MTGNKQLILNSHTIKICILSIMIFVISTIPFLQARNYEFTNLDDDELIINNPYLDGSGIPWMLTIFSNANVHRYMPLTMLHYSVLKSVFGLHTAPYHLISIAYHGVCAVIVFIMVTKFGLLLPIASVVTLLWALHPNTVESVVWIGALSTPLYTWLFLVSFLVFVRNIQRGSRNVSFLSLFLYILSCFAKPTAVLMPAILTPYLIWKRYSWKLIVRLVLPYASISLVFACVGWRMVGPFHLTDNFEYYGWIERIFLGSNLLTQYLIKFVVPYWTVPFNTFPPRTNGFFPLTVYVSLMVPVVVAVICIKLFRSRQAAAGKILSGVLWFLLFISLHVELIPMGNPDYLGERYTYMAYIGLFYSAGQIVAVMSEQYGRHILKFGLSVATLFLAIYVYGIYTRIPSWKSSETMWKTSITRDPDNYEAHYNYGRMLRSVGRLSEAIKEQSYVIEKAPTLARAYNERGLAYRQQGNYPAAIADYDTSLSLRPGYTAALFNRGMLYIVHKKNPGAGIRDLSQAIQLDPSLGIAYLERGKVYRTMQQMNDACRDFRAAGQMGVGEAQMLYTRDCLVRVE